MAWQVTTSFTCSSVKSSCWYQPIKSTWIFWWKWYCGKCEGEGHRQYLTLRLGKLWTRSGFLTIDYRSQYPSDNLKCLFASMVNTSMIIAHCPGWDPLRWRVEIGFRKLISIKNLQVRFFPIRASFCHIACIFVIYGSWAFAWHASCEDWWLQSLSRDVWTSPSFFYNITTSLQHNHFGQCRPNVFDLLHREVPFEAFVDTRLFCIRERNDNHLKNNDHHFILILKWQYPGWKSNSYLILTFVNHC
jgi:hypothetical protein